MRTLGFALICGFVLSTSHALAGVTYVAERDTVYSSATTSWRNTRPTGTAFDVCVIGMIKGDDPAFSQTATGFTQFGDASGSSGDDCHVWGGLRVIQHTEANTIDSMISTSDSEELSGGTGRFRGVDMRDPRQRTVAGFSYTTNTNDPVCGAVVTGEDSCLVVFFAGTTDTSTAATVTDPSGVTRLWVRKDVSGNFWNSSFCGYQIFPTPGSTGSKTWDLNTTAGTAEVITFSVVLRPDSDNKYRNERLLRVGARQFRMMMGQIQ